VKPPGRELAPERICELRGLADRAVRSLESIVFGTAATVTLRRLLAVALLVAPALESGASVLALAADPHACTGHVCFCAPRPAARAETCHGGGLDRTAMTGACHHDTTTPVLAAVTPYLLPAAPALPAADDGGPAPRGRARDVASGHQRILLPPPRTA
jgi:hypothetical protein